MSDALDLATQLVQQAPALAPATVTELADVLARDGSPLALAIARVLAGVALPELADACATLVVKDERAREAARYRIDTLLPMPRIDVSVDRLRR